jgi:hypothetical protein
VAPNTSLNVWEPTPNSGVFVLPTTIAPPARHHQPVGGGDMVGEQGRSVGGSHPGRVLEILDRDGQAVQRPEWRARGGARVCLSRLGECAVGFDGHDGAQRPVAMRDAVEVRGDHFDRRQLAVADRAGEGPCGAPVKLPAHWCNNAHGSSMSCALPLARACKGSF